MSRLIRDDELKKWFEPYKGLDVPCAEVCRRIDNMPTAYNVEAVVKELEELRDSVDNEYA